MNLKQAVSILSLTGTCLAVFGQAPTPQALPMEAPFESAYEQHSRSLDGKPGEAYFQNHADYDIQVSIDPDDRVLSGAEVVTYFNQSPDTLSKLVFRTYQDFYKPEFDRDMRIAPGDMTDGLELDRVVLAGDTLDLIEKSGEVKRQGTNLFIPLESGLAPGDSIEVEIAWHFQISAGGDMRMGSYGKNKDLAYFLAYWYPQVAVYDDIVGWDEYDYNGLHEFYQDFGDFKVSITAPESFLVWSTGKWQNPADILKPTYLSRYQEAWETDSVVRIVDYEDIRKKAQITLDSEGTHTWSFEAEGVPDFAFCLSNYYFWDATSAKVDDEGRRVLTETCYAPGATYFEYVAEFAQQSVEDLSKNTPGVAYPYPKLTVFQGGKGGGGMEYPMMVNNSISYHKGATFQLVYHEIAHTYFPFLMGINERRYAWMDEGWASYLPMNLTKELGHGDRPALLNTLTFQKVAKGNYPPLMTNTHELKGTAYYTYAYSHPAVAYSMLHEVLGDSVFRLGMQMYIDRWSGKHPIPYDFFFTFNEASGEDLGWFWKPWFFESPTPDLKLRLIDRKKKNISLVIQNKGGMPVPVHLSFELANGQTIEKHLSPAVWKNQRELEITESFDAKVQRITLGRYDIPDSYPKDNKLDFRKTTKD
ncbi:M1 family metallopeptidase [Pontibacter sp. G13]|uniref:M1 family metallopeptidase n=1 Tax=Pontibacter sp. G13 TaxID=3074898 RepID=UPI002889C821|nr:M1 family metallopeptidase [Pontibacter sp. G13]WNJ21083.1 M1 family metallopeptidase [Pontibacter sp. G13]